MKEERLKMELNSSNTKLSNAEKSLIETREEYIEVQKSAQEIEERFMNFRNKKSAEVNKLSSERANFAVELPTQNTGVSLLSKLLFVLEQQNK